MKKIIFNLGLSKTGTSSFTRLMKDLNLTSRHDMDISSHTIDELRKEFVYCDSFSGALTHRYKDIYEALPTSKYILTIRDSNSWLKSTRIHFRNADDGRGMGMKQYREAIYGTWKIWELSDEKLLEIYNNWNYNIIDFFKDKENFMILNFVNSTDTNKLMKELLDFLELTEKVWRAGKSEKIKFPHSNESKVVK